MPDLTIENLELEIHGIPVLRGVSVEVRPGRVTGLVGESGSGKSMTSLAAMRLLPRGSVTRGRIDFGGRDLLGLGEPEMCRVRGREIGMVFQEPMTALNPLRTIGDQVAEGFRLHLGLGRDEARERARLVLERVGMPASRVPPTRYPHELSGGQRQRVVIGMAVALSPGLVIADEPTTALDVTTQAQVLRLLRDLVAQDGAGLLLISHDLAVIGAMADEIAVMRRGEIVEQGPAASFFRSMRHPYSRALLAASSHAPAREPSPAGAETVLDVDGAVRDYTLPRTRLFAPAPRLRAVDGVSFAVRRGESVGLVGESGCGKSTLARAILGLEPVQGGAIRLMGESIAGLAAEARRRFRRRVQIVFQDPFGSFDPRHTAGRIVGEPLHLLRGELAAGEREARVAAALEEVGLSAADAARYPHEFSGGQRQRLAIARALITRPDLIVLDEPVSALDVSIRAQVLDLLAGLQARMGLTYLFISHDLGVVRAITDRVLVMQKGRVVEEGPTQDVLDRPSHPYTKELVASALHLAETLADRAASQAAD
ncbi:dipeptide ABC transporter ATP-binding protein [Alsobacter sp. SYSU M60028]|uniref:Dipeptide ABC transporter ATP-binding protein n=1 Tax=Alsobacter ponti TaxID=2962936 RepID=A0ABT1L852_9HYPH|nr:dipeptide ABC transporter ATP-binding protein [Alsobacter ponti]